MSDYVNWFATLFLFGVIIISIFGAGFLCGKFYAQMHREDSGK